MGRFHGITGSGRRAAGALIAGATFLGGCTAVPYYAQAVAGEARLLCAARPIPDWIDDPATSADLRTRLELAQRMRRFASDALALPDNRSYTSYADLHRRSAVWSVFAAPADSLRLKTWCYPVFGCAAYRGYFDAQDAGALAASLGAEGWDVAVLPVPAYSTLGWLPDPLLSTFVRWPESEFAKLVFHELAHQLVYVADDTRFNESFATAVEREGVARWIAARGDAHLEAQWRESLEHRAVLVQLVQRARAALEEVYAQGVDVPAGAPAGATAGPPALVQRKEEIFARMQADYEALRAGPWAAFDGYDAFFRKPWNNARVAAMATYEDDVPAFQALLARSGGELPRFYEAVRRLAALPAGERDAELRALAPVQPLPPVPPGAGAGPKS